MDAGFGADAFVSGFSSGPQRMFELVVNGSMLLPVVSVKLGSLGPMNRPEQLMPITEDLEAAAAALAAQAPGAHLRCAQVHAVPPLRSMVQLVALDLSYSPETPCRCCRAPPP